METNKFDVSFFTNAMKSACCSSDTWGVYFLEVSISIYITSMIQTSWCRRWQILFLSIHILVTLSTIDYHVCQQKYIQISWFILCKTAHFNITSTICIYIYAPISWWYMYIVMHAYTKKPLMKRMKNLWLFIENLFQPLHTYKKCHWIIPHSNNQCSPILATCGESPIATMENVHEWL